MSSSAQTPQVGKRKYHCQTCNGENVLEVCINSASPQLDHVTCTEIILGILRAHGFTLGDFIMTALDHKMPFNQSTTESLKHFIQGHTKKNHPIDIIHALYCHPYACPSSRYEPSHLPLPSSAIPLDGHQPVQKSGEKGYTYSELQQYFVDQSIKCIKLEMDTLLHDDYWCVTNSETDRFDWDVILSFSIESTLHSQGWDLIRLQNTAHKPPFIGPYNTGAPIGVLGPPT